MRVGVITDAFPPEVGGVQTFADQYVTHLSQADEVEHLDVLAFTPGEDEERPGVSIRRIDTDQTPTKLLAGVRWFRRHQFAVVHALTLYPGGLVAAACDTLDPSIRTFATVYGLDAISLADHPILRRVHRYVFGTLDEVLFFSDSTRKKTHEAYRTPFPSRRIYPGVPRFSPDERELSDTFPGLTDDPERFVVLTVARLVERKGIDDLIEAVAGTSDVVLWIAGTGPQREALERQVPAGAADRVTFLGEVPHDDLPALYRRADLFSLPSIYLRDAGDIEGLGLVFLEAQQFGTPVLGTRSGGIPEALADGETGFLVDERSPEQLGARIAELRDNPELHEQFSENAVRFVGRRFGWERCVRNHIDAYTA